MPSPAGRYTRSGLCDEVVGVGCCPQTAFGGQPGHRRLAKCDAGSFVGTSSISFTSAQSAKAHPFRCASSQNRNRVAGLRFCIFCARWRNVGFCTAAAHTLAGWAENRTQRRHAPHGAVQAFGAPAGSIGSIFSTVGRSAPSTLFRQISRSPLLFRNETKMPFFLRASTLFRIWCEKLFGVQSSLPAGSIFSNNAFAGALISDSFCRSSERRISI